MAKRLRIEMGEIRHNLTRFDSRANDAIAKVFRYQQTAAENYMRANAPWTDRTTNARNSLYAKAESEAVDTGNATHSLLLAHGVSYGIYLETMQSGRYGVIVPAWLHTSDELWAMLRKLFALMEGG